MKLVYYFLFLFLPFSFGLAPGTSVTTAETAQTPLDGPLPEGTYRLVARHSDLALTAAGDRSGDDVKQQPWSNNANQHWQLRHEHADRYTLLSRASGLALDVDGRRNGLNVKQARDNGSKDRRWRLVRAGRSGGRAYYRLVNDMSRKSLEVSGGPGATKAGTTAQQSQYDGKANQQWYVEPVAAVANVQAPADIPLPEGTYRLVARHSDLALTAAGDRSGDDVKQQPWSNNANQHWQLRHEHADRYTLLSRASGLALDVDGRRNGLNVKQARDNGSKDRRWRLVRAGRSGGRAYYRLVNDMSRKSLQVRGGTGATAPGVTVDQRLYEKKTNQQWYVEPVATRAGGGISSNPKPVIEPIRLPLEVMGGLGTTEEIQLHLSSQQAQNAALLYLQLHRPAYRDASVNPRRGAKVSLRINRGPWLDLSNETAGCLPHEEALGCLGGAYHTLRLTVALKRLTGSGSAGGGLRAGANTVAFRFNGTDGFTSGYRVLAVNLLPSRPAGAKLKALLPPSAFEDDDPAKWRAPRPSPGDLAAGKRLWYEARLNERPGGAALRATCSGCHASDGADLKYFNYSNKSIVERARFHGLSTKEAEQVASYIRALKSAAPRQARPWNPPYQPGPGLDRKPVAEWSAGAGLSWVLETDAEMERHLFPGGLGSASVDPSATLNLRELPIAMQLPDWNAWLPEVHPLDVWGEFFLKTTPISGSPNNRRGDVLGHFDQLVGELEGKGLSRVLSLGELDNRVEGFSSAGVKYFLDGRYGGALSRRRRGMRSEEAVRSVRHWTVVKLWEVNRRWGLEDKSLRVYGSGADRRSWLGVARQVFDLAPHLAADKNGAFAFQDDLAGNYTSTAWYELQAILNSGNRHGGTNVPVDWNYQPNFISGFHQYEPGATFITVSAWIKQIQSFHYKGRVLREEPYVRQGHPGRWAGFSALRRLPAAKRAALFSTMVTAYLDAVEPHNGKWNRGTRRHQWEPASYKPRMIDDMSWTRASHVGRHADLWYTMIPTFRKWGVDNDVLDRAIDWGQKMWPKGNWGALRAGSNNRVAAAQGLALTEAVLDNGSPDVPLAYALEGAYPSPFNPTTTIRFALPEQARVQLEVFDALGRRVATLAEGSYRAGWHQATFEASSLASGVYLYRIEADGAAGRFTDTGKVLLAK